MIQKSCQPVDTENISLFPGFQHRTIPGLSAGFLPSTIPDLLTIAVDELREWDLEIQILVGGLVNPKTMPPSLPLKIGQALKSICHLPTVHFKGGRCQFRGGGDLHLISCHYLLSFDFISCHCPALMPPDFQPHIFQLSVAILSNQTIILGNFLYKTYQWHKWQYNHA